MGHLSQDEIKGTYARAKEKVRVGGKYTHFKNPHDEYIVLEIGFLEETEMPYVVYKAQYGEGLAWIRPLENFIEEVNRDGYRGPRFVEATSD
jgi:hypothetical protein